MLQKLKKTSYICMKIFKVLFQSLIIISIKRMIFKSNKCVTLCTQGLLKQKGLLCK